MEKCVRDSGYIMLIKSSSSESQGVYQQFQFDLDKLDPLIGCDHFMFSCQMMIMMVN